MTKRERVSAAIAGRPVDRPPVAFWRHVPELDHDPARLAEAMLAFHRRWDLDLIKLMSSGVYGVEDWGCVVAYQGAPSGAKQCVEHAVKGPADWGRLRPLDPGAGALGRELEALRRVARGRPDDAPLLHTVFSPLTLARKLAGDRLARDLETAPAEVEAALAVITDTLARYCLAALEAGADGLFFATQTGSAEFIPMESNARFGAPWARRALEPVRARGALVLLHIHGRQIYFDQLVALPVDAVNWHDRLTPPSLGEGRRRVTGAVVGGLSEWETLRRGRPEAVADEVREAIAQTGGRGTMVAPGCVLPLDVPDAALEAVVATVRAARLDGSGAAGAGSG